MDIGVFVKLRFDESVEVEQDYIAIETHKIKAIRTKKNIVVIEYGEFINLTKFYSEDKALHFASVLTKCIATKTSHKGGYYFIQIID